MKVKQNGEEQNKKTVNSFYSHLGIPHDFAVLLPNHDDLGMSWGSNQAFKDLAKCGFIKSSSVMVPCPWFPSVIKEVHKHPYLNIGVHLTLTSEWEEYRWRPLSSSKKSSGLIDNDGFFWKNRSLLRQNVNVSAAEIELKTQIETALSSGIDVTHLDCHMGIGFIPELFDIYIKLGVKYKLPVLLVRNIDMILDLYKIESQGRELYYETVRKLDDEGYPLFDEFKITPCFDTSTALEDYKNYILNLPKGCVTFFSLHPNNSGDIEQIDPIMHHIRTDEFKVFNTLTPQWAIQNKIKLISFRQIREIYRKIM